MREKVEEDLVWDGYHYFTNFNELPVRQHQIYDELFKKQNEFAGTIYYQRCLEKLL